jgi:branched-chain amino acid transport system permease protein
MISGVDADLGRGALLGQPMRASLRANRRAGHGPHLPARAPAGPAQRARERGLGAHLRGARAGWPHAAPGPRRGGRLLAEARRQIERCGLGEFAERPAASLALGQQRIVEIARALAGQPAALLLDEPAAGLRHLEKQALADLLDQLRSEGLGILVVEHDMVR